MDRGKLAAPYGGRRGAISCHLFSEQRLKSGSDGVAEITDPTADRWRRNRVIELGDPTVCQ